MKIFLIHCGCCFFIFFLHPQDFFLEPPPPPPPPPAPPLGLAVGHFFLRHRQRLMVTLPEDEPDEPDELDVPIIIIFLKVGSATAYGSASP